MPAGRWREGDSGTMKREWVFSRISIKHSKQCFSRYVLHWVTVFSHFSSLKNYDSPWDHTWILK